jgi:hypothetical protein
MKAHTFSFLSFIAARSVAEPANEATGDSLKGFLCEPSERRLGAVVIISGAKFYRDSP